MQTEHLKILGGLKVVVDLPFGFAECTPGIALLLTLVPTSSSHRAGRHRYTALALASSIVLEVSISKMLIILSEELRNFRARDAAKIVQTFVYNQVFPPILITSLPGINFTPSIKSA